MKCELGYCIYNKTLECMLADIQINALGMCDACIIVSLDVEILNLAKKNQLFALENQWNDRPGDYNASVFDHLEQEIK